MGLKRTWLVVEGQRLFICKTNKSKASKMEERENPFLENDEILVCVDTKDIAVNIVRDTVNKIESVGKQESQEFFTERLVKKTKCVNSARISYPFLAINHHYSQNIHLTPQPSKRA